MAKSLALALSIFAASTTSAFALEYTVKQGDTLSKVALQYIKGKVYGSNGSLTKLLVVNPTIHDPNNLTPGQVVRIPDELVTITPAPLSSPAAAPASPPPPPAPAPAQVVREEPPPRHSKLMVGGAMFDTRVNTKGKSTTSAYKASSHSDPQYEAKVGWSQPLTELLLVEIFGEIRTVKFPAVDQGQVDGYDSTLKGFSAALEFDFTKSFYGKLELGLHQEVFSYRDGEKHITWDDVFIDEYGLGLGYFVFNRASWALGPEFKYAYAGRANGDGFKVMPGMQYGADLLFIYRFSNDFETQTRLFYERRAQDTDRAIQKTTNNGVYVGVGYHIGS